MLSAFLPAGILVFALFIGVAALVNPALTFHCERGSHGKMSFTWDYKDWIGLAIILVVVVALLEGVDPKELLRILTGNKG